MNYIEEEPMSDLCRKLLDCMVAHTVSADDILKHGKWLISSDGYYPYCSECGKEPKNREMTKFCAECGAKMDKE